MARNRTVSVLRKRVLITTWSNPPTLRKYRTSWRPFHKARSDEKTMLTSTKPLRVLIVDDNRDGADTLGLLVEELGNQVHVTYGGTNALKVATTFRPDLI